MKILVCLIVAFFSVAATKKNPKLASLSSQEAQMSAPAMKVKASTPSKSSVYGQVRIEGMQYFTEIPESPQLTYSQLVSARLSSLQKLDQIDFAADISGGTFFTKGQSHFVVHETYLASELGNSLRVSVGRKKADWSELDRHWQMGLWQPKFAIDALRPEEQGLTGLFVGFNKPEAEVTVFFTPIFIPSMGPDIREEGGSLVADSRWYRTPSRDYDFNNRINTIQYELNIPEAAKLITNGGASMLGRLGNRRMGPWISASAAYLPVNQLILKRKNFKNISEDLVDVTVSPDVAYHGLVSLDVGYATRAVKAELSFLADEPYEKQAESDWSIQTLAPIEAYSASLDISGNEIFNRPFSMQVNYLRVLGGGIVDKTSEGIPDDFTLFDHRLQFTHALSFRVEGQLMTLKKRPFVTRLKYLYEYDQRGSLLNTEFLYYPNQEWAIIFGADILGVRDETSVSSRFLNEYRANDRFYGGMTYVF